VAWILRKTLPIRLRIVRLRSGNVVTGSRAVSIRDLGGNVSGIALSSSLAAALAVARTAEARCASLGDTLFVVAARMFAQIFLLTQVGHWTGESFTTQS